VNRLISLVLVFVIVGHLVAQECDELKDATPQRILEFLRADASDEAKAGCTVFAINALGQELYLPAADTLASLLDFRRPPTQMEKDGYYIKSNSRNFCPAVQSLELLGRDALPAVLKVITSSSSSGQARMNAVEVWMATYKHDAPEGVAVLRREGQASKDAISKEHLSWAVSQALKWCNPPDQERCAAAARGQ